MSGPLGVSCLLSAPGQGAIDLDAGPYRLEASTRNDRSVTWRKQEVTNPFVEGSYLIGAVRDNVIENVSVYVRGTSHADMDRGVNAVLDRVEQIAYQMVWTYPTRTETWTCQAAAYSVSTEQAYQHATLALLKMQVPRLPRLVISYSDTGATVTR